MALLGAYQVTGSFTDSDFSSDTFTATVDYGDGSPVQTLKLKSGSKTFKLAHTYAILGTYTVTVTITDDQGMSGTGQATVTAL